MLVCFITKGNRNRYRSIRVQVGLSFTANLCNFCAMKFSIRKLLSFPDLQIVSMYLHPKLCMCSQSSEFYIFLTDKTKENIAAAGHPTQDLIFFRKKLFFPDFVLTSIFISWKNLITSNFYFERKYKSSHS